MYSGDEDSEHYYADLGEGTLERVTDEAALVDLDSHLHPEWIPFSVMTLNTVETIRDATLKETLDEVWVREWFAVEKGLV